MNPEKPWTLSVGIHAGDVTSRDICPSEKLESLEACHKRTRELEESFRRLGHYIWFAEAVGPGGKKEKTHLGVPYR